MLNRWMLLLLLVAAAFPATRAETRPTLTIYTYDSFAGDWGAGPAIRDAFEAECGCAVKYVTVDAAGLLLTRLRFEGARTQADIILGLDTALMEEARATGLLAPHGIEVPPLTLPFGWTDSDFLPYDYGHFAVVYDSQALPSPPATLAELVEGDGAKLIIPDPRTSTPGLGLLLWLKQVYGAEDGAAWRSLSRRLLTVTKGWSEAYGLFQAGEAPMVLSYATSPAYHQMFENTHRYKAAIFPEGHYAQVEVAARTKDSGEPELAQDFLRFMLEQKFQEQIPAVHIMNPVIDLGDALPDVFRTLPEPETLEPFAPDVIARNRRNWIDDWLEQVGR